MEKKDEFMVNIWAENERYCDLEEARVDAMAHAKTSPNLRFAIWKLVETWVSEPSEPKCE